MPIDVWMKWNDQLRVRISYRNMVLRPRRILSWSALRQAETLGLGKSIFMKAEEMQASLLFRLLQLDFLVIATNLMLFIEPN